MNEEVEVYLGETDPTRVGWLRPSFQGGRNLAAASFEYDPSFIRAAGAYPLSPDLPLTAGPSYSGAHQTIFGAFADASPDQWGQKIIDANHAVRRKRDPTLPARIGAFDYLLGVSDRTRMGALRFRDVSSGGWLSEDSGVANLHDIDRIVQAAQRYEDDEATDEDVEYLGDIATSPGGARPKANVILPSGHLALAKLPHSKDREFDTEAWEDLALTIADNAGIRTAPRTLLPTGNSGRSVLLVERFDRMHTFERIGYISAATAMGLGENDDHRSTYENFADVIADLSASARRDLNEMFRRVALSVLINNSDDHWRNHGFLRQQGGWELAPAFDINPSPRRGSLSSRAINSDDDPRERDIRNLVASADAYAMSQDEASAAVHWVATEVVRWPALAAARGISDVQQERMAVAFNEEQLDHALALSPIATTVIPLTTEDAARVWIPTHTRSGKPVGGYWRRGR